MGDNGSIVKEELEVPSISHLARIYRGALASGDQTIASAAEAAAMKVSNAEGALSEAVSMTRFIDDASV
jgi:hypothetical protein